MQQHSYFISDWDSYAILGGSVRIAFPATGTAFVVGFINADSTISTTAAYCTSKYKHFNWSWSNIFSCALKYQKSILSFLNREIARRLLLTMVCESQLGQFESVDISLEAPSFNYILCNAVWLPVACCNWVTHGILMKSTKHTHERIREI